MIGFCSEWTETFPYDFRDERMMRALKDMTQISAVISPVSCPSLSLSHTFISSHPQELRRDVGQVQSALIQKLSILDRYEHVLAQVNTMAMERLVDPHTQVMRGPVPIPSLLS